jgi:hypothetical protein
LAIFHSVSPGWTSYHCVYGFSAGAASPALVTLSSIVVSLQVRASFKRKTRDPPAVVHPVRGDGDEKNLAIQFMAGCESPRLPWRRIVPRQP